MRGAIIFVVWLTLFVAQVVTTGLLSVGLFVAMIGASMYGGHVFAGWRMRRVR